MSEREINYWLMDMDGVLMEAAAERRRERAAAEGPDGGDVIDLDSRG